MPFKITVIASVVPVLFFAIDDDVTSIFSSEYSAHPDRHNIISVIHIRYFFILSPPLIHNTLTYNNFSNGKLLENNFNIIIFLGIGVDRMKHVHMRLNELLVEHEISKNKICKDLDLARGNFNRYCRDDFQRIDANLIIKLCDYFECTIEDLLVIVDD